ncbi:MAG: hypothetical protein RLZZ579_976 [Actinomycetota bacterium]|jgi:signal transduction histidine kinase
MNRIRDLQIWLTGSAIFLYVPVSFISTALALPNSGLSFLQIFWIGCLVTGLAILVLLIGLFIEPLLNFSRPVKLAIFFGIVLLAGGLRGWLLAELALQDGQVAAEQVLSRVINSALSASFWLFSFSLIFSALKKNRSNFRSQFAEIVQNSSRNLKLTEIEIAEEIDQLHNIRSLKKSLQGIVQSTVNSTLSENELLVAAGKLRNEIENSLRPLSHRIWFNEQTNQPEFRLLGLISHALSAPKFFPMITALLSSAWFVIGAYSLAPLGPILLKASVSGALLFIFLVLAEKIPPDLFRNMFFSTSLILGVSYLNYFLGDAAVLLITGRVWIENASTSFVLLPLALAILILVLAVLAVVKDDFELLTSLVEESGLRLDSQTRSRFAGYLHNSLQAELTSLAMQLERAALENQQGVKQTLARLAEVAERSIGADFTAREVGADLRLKQVITGWDGIIQVDVDICPELKGDSVKFPLFVELCEEAIANAARHARASSLSIFTTATNKGIEIWISNPMNAEQGQNQSLGMAWLNKYAKEVEFSGNQAGFHKIHLFL